MHKTTIIHLTKKEVVKDFFEVKEFLTLKLKVELTNQQVIEHLIYDYLEESR